MELLDMSQKDMILSMIDNGLTSKSDSGGNFRTFKPLSEIQIYNMIKQCAAFSKLDFDYSNEPLYYIMLDTRITLVSATAGAGKTTLTCNKVDREIRLRGKNPRSICMLSFNNDSVADLKKKMQHVINNNNIVTRRYGIYLEERDIPNIRSLNSLTYNLVDQYKDYWHLGSINIISNEDANIRMSRTIGFIQEDLQNFEVSENLIANCLSLYDLLNETCKTVEELKNHSTVMDTGLPVETLTRIINSYKTRLNVDNKLHHSDTARLVLERCDEDKDFRKVVENLYELIVVDELQDISESVYRLLKIMVNDKNRLIAIGDGDQAIYGFKGARSDTCYRFKDDFQDAKLCTLSVNRRCAEEILNYAKCIITPIHKRIPQELHAIRKGGEVHIEHYENSITAVKQIATYLRDIPKDVLGTMCIGFRKNVTCYYIAQKLMEEGIPFRVRPEMMPGQDKLSQHLKEIFAMLKSPSNIDLALKTLYKVTAIKKISDKDMEAGLEDINVYMDENDLEYFYELPADVLPIRYGKQRLVEEQMNILKQASNLVRKRGTMKEVMELIYPQFEDSYWNFTKRVTSFQPELEEMVKDIYGRDETYIEFQCRRKEMEDSVQRYISKGYGIKLSSFHSLKGLEFNEVFLVELDSKNLPLIRESNSMSESELTNLIDEELRLFYVAATRARDRLFVYWSSADPSSFEGINADYSKLTQSTKTDTILSTSEIDLADIALSDSDLDINLSAQDIDDSTIQTVDITKEFDDDNNLDLDIDINIDINIETEDVKPTSSINNQKPTEVLTTALIDESVESFLNEEEKESIHLREDFVDVRNGDQLQNVLGFICNVIEAKKEVQ